MSDIQSFLKAFSSTSTDIEKIAESGSGRANYRFRTQNDSYILTESDNVKENESFFYLSNIFSSLNGNVPEVLSVRDDAQMYIQDDLGNVSLLALRKTDKVAAQKMYAEAVKKLAHLQIGAHQIIDYNKIYESSSFDRMLVNRDLFYFKNYYLDLLHIPYVQADLLAEFDEIGKRVEKAHYRYFMFRDFQGRNIIVHKDEPHFIDFQDGMEGPIAYDLASLLWQAKAQLTDEEKDELYQTYTHEVHKLLPDTFDFRKFREDYEICVLMRLMQVMGAYGKLGILQQKPHFKESIAFGVRNLKTFSDKSLMKDFPVLRTIFEMLDEESLPNFTA